MSSHHQMPNSTSTDEKDIIVVVNGVLCVVPNGYFNPESKWRKANPKFCAKSLEDHLEESQKAAAANKAARLAEAATAADQE